MLIIQIIKTLHIVYYLLQIYSLNFQRFYHSNKLSPSYMSAFRNVMISSNDLLLFLIATINFYFFISSFFTNSFSNSSSSASYFVFARDTVSFALSIFSSIEIVLLAMITSSLILSFIACFALFQVC
jgi:hypothetical protein